MKSAAKILLVIASMLLGIAITSCISQQPLTKEERKVPPQILETAYNLVRAKLVKLHLVEKIIVEIDTAMCYKSYSMRYDSWFMEMLNIGHRLENNNIHYKLSVFGKPYIHYWERIAIQDPRNIFLTRFDDGFAFGDMRQFLCRETVPDTALEQIRIWSDFTGACYEDYLPMTADEAITTVRRTFQLDSSIPCVRAWPYKGRYDIERFDIICKTGEAGFWNVVFKVEPSDTTVYYNLKAYTDTGEEEIQRILNRRNKRDGTCECPEIVLWVRVDAETGNICLVSIDYHILSDVGGDIPERLYPFERRVMSIRDSLATVYWR